MLCAFFGCFVLFWRLTVLRFSECIEDSASEVQRGPNIYIYIYMYMYMYMYIGCAASEASEAIKRLQFHHFGTTFGASEAPGHGASIYDGLKVDFEIDPTKKIEI